MLFSTKCGMAKGTFSRKEIGTMDPYSTTDSAFFDRLSRILCYSVDQWTCPGSDGRVSTDKSLHPYKDKSTKIEEKRPSNGMFLPRTTNKGRSKYADLKIDEGHR
jgi:hypothetical protein